jgi:spoIIIJ-associated protein
MQWVETTGKSVDEAKGLALDQLGVAEDDAEFEIVAEPKTGLFGRLKIEARVRARVKPTNVRPKLDNRDRRRSRDEAKAAAKAAKSSDGDGTEVLSAEKPKSPRPAQKPKTGGQSARQQQPQRDDVETRAEKPKKSQPVREESQVSAQQVGEEATKFMAELVTAFGLSGTVSLKEDGDDLEVRVEGEDLGLMVGPRGNTLQAIQDLARVAAQRRLGDHDTRLRVDVGGYRERRREALGRFAAQIAAQVTETGSARALEPMSSADRKVIHDFLTDHEGVVTRSEGDDPNRRVVIAPANA